MRRPDLTFAVQDHTVASKPGRTDETYEEGAPFLRATRAGTARHGIRLFDLGDPEQGISHVVAPELGMVLPGATHAVTITIPALLRAATVVAVVPEARKAEPVRRALTGPVDTSCPASILREHAHVTLHLDTDSASAWTP